MEQGIQAEGGPVSSGGGYRRAEGDINGSEARAAWQEAYLDAEARELLEEDEAYFLRQSLSTPCLNAVERCEGIYLWDVQGRKIMDFHGNNVHHVGYGHPEVTEAVKRQLDTLSFSPRRYANRPAVELAKKLVALAPDGLDKVLFSPGATSAVGMALKLARAATGRYKTVSLWDSFHGASLDAISVGGEAAFRRGMGPLLPGAMHTLPVNNYRCLFGECGSCRMECLKLLEYTLEKDGEVGAVIMETVRNTDVQIPPSGYYRKVRELCDRYGALLILDETAIGLGKTGAWFAFEHYGIVPDMVVLGKALGGGVFPMAALLVRAELDVAAGMSLGHYTHEKSPVGAAAALAALEVTERGDLPALAAAHGAYALERLRRAQQELALIGDVRGIGLLLAVELVKDRKTKAPAVDEAERIMYRCLSRGLSFKVSQGNVLTLSPPLVTTREELDCALDIVIDGIREESEAAQGKVR